MFDFPNGPIPGAIFEPNGAGADPSYTFDGIGWVYGATTNLLISSVIPNSAICGSVAIPAVRALGANFTATCEILIDGVAVVTTFVSVSELTFPINPVPETVPKTVVITVRDGATLGAGAVPFNFTIVTTIDYRIGIDETSPGIVDLLPANTINEIGGVTVVPRAADQGLALDLATGALTAPLATPLLAGSLIEPPDDSKGYVRQTTGASSTWVPPALPPAGPDFGIGLSLDDTTDPDIVHLTPAGDSPATLGGVYVIDRVRNVSEGLELGIDGRLRAPLATDSLAGTMLEPPLDDRGYVRTYKGGIGAWVIPADTPLPDYGIGIDLNATTPPGTVNLLPAKYDPPNLGGVYILPATGIGITDDGGLAGIRATPSVQGMLRDAPYDAKNYARKDGAWIEATAPLPTDLPIAGNIEAERGVVWVPDDRGLNVDPTGQLWLRPATSQQYGGLTLPTDPTGTKTFMRRVSDWVEAPVADLKPAGDTKAEIGVVFVPARTNMQALTLNVDGQLTCLLATPQLAGAILEPPADDKGYVRQTSSKGGSSWVPPALPPGVYTDDAPPAVPTEDQLWFDTDSGDLLIYINDGTSSQWVSTTGGGSSYLWGVGLDENTTTPGTIDLRVANTNGEIGGVLTIGRGPTQGLDLDMATGLLTAPLATHVAAGSIVEPPADGAIYSRQRTTAGVSSWVPGAAGVFIGDDPPPAPTAGMLWFESDTGDTHVWYADIDSGQWVQI